MNKTKNEENQAPTPPLEQTTIFRYSDSYSVLHPSFGGVDTEPVTVDGLTLAGLIGVLLGLLPEIKPKEEKSP